ncbi:hypothetical protein JR316_0010767 [Psilocybe cubensis]|uniref:Uncharacterized protein n=2 Tax=Psilocybe cubensis TaxID=181762 RepID=A0ACB8GMR2_PSICU|nr:hypothetical protein JR316_0010767 [Psilocybe cubensis]KAH9476851.1 hypothetical protein JR316_0010767 [Psilocybe cubensis]
MAAIYLHNALNTRDSSDIQGELPEHSRHHSTVSTTTLHTNTTSAHSQPNEPLLHPSSPQRTVSVYQRSFHETRLPHETVPQLRWTDPPAPFEGSSSPGEKSRTSLQGTRKPWRRRKRIRFSLQVVIAIWSAYNVARYFIASRLYGSDTLAGRSICLALGISAGITFAITFLTLVLSGIKQHLQVHSPALRRILQFFFLLQHLASFTLLAPAAVAFALTFIWKNSPNHRYNVHSRCHLSVDIVWSVTTNPCHDGASSWAIWLLLSCIRLAITFFIIAIYHTLTLLHPDFPRRPPLHHRLRSGSETLTPISSSIIVPHQDRQQDLRVYHQPSDVSLGGATLKEATGRSIRPARSHSSDFSGETAHGDAQGYGRTPSGSVESEGKYDQCGYGERFRSLLSQISQETDAAVEYARHESPENISESAHLPPSYSPGNDDDDDNNDDVYIHEHTQGRHNSNIFNLPPVAPTLGYNEFGLPYPPDQDVRMLNGYIRRMPTIESMGSGEIASSIGASSVRQGGSMYTSSRPPTRNTLLSFASTDYDMMPANGSNPPSRANSLSARAELLLGGATEHGELMVGRSDPSAMRRMSTPNSIPDRPPSSPITDTFSTGTAGSRGTNASYHTATTGSSGDSLRPPYSHHDALS